MSELPVEESTKNDFIASYNELVSQISTDIKKLKSYLDSEEKES